MLFFVEVLHIPVVGYALSLSLVKCGLLTWYIIWINYSGLLTIYDLRMKTLSIHRLLFSKIYERDLLVATLTICWPSMDIYGLPWATISYGLLIIYLWRINATFFNILPLVEHPSSARPGVLCPPHAIWSTRWYCRSSTLAKGGQFFFVPKHHGHAFSKLVGGLLHGNLFYFSICWE